MEVADPVPTHCVDEKQTAVSAVQIPPIAQANEVSDELVEEHSEVEVSATGLFENCPDSELSDDYFVSLRKFIFSEPHLQSNIVSVKIAKLSSRQFGVELFEHSVKVEILVKTGRLWEPPAAYSRKHLTGSDWLKGNKTRITLGRIM